MTVTRAAFLAALVLLVAGIAFGRAWVVTWTAPAFSPPAPIAVRVITATPLPRVSHRVARAATKKPHPSPRHTQPVHHHAVATPRPTPTPTVAMPSPSPTPTRPVLAHPLRHTQPHRKLATHRHIHRRPRATARPTRTSLPSPTSTPATGPVELANYWVGSQVARRGQTVAIGYVIDNPTGHVEHLSLGASIKSGRVLNWGDSLADPPHDVVATIPPGVSTHIRYFTLPAGIRPGRYDVAWGLRNATSGNRAALVFASGALTVTR